jgi:OTU domain-containing protein 5
MGGGGKLFPVRKERELLEVKQRTSEQTSDSNTTASAASTENGDRDEEAFNRQFAVGAASLVAGRPREAGVAVAAGNQNHNSKDHRRGEGNLKSEYDNDDPAFEDHNVIDDGDAISLSGKWDSLSTSPFASASTFARSAAAASSLAVKSIEEDPATISKTDLTDSTSLSQYAHALRTNHTPSLEINPMQGDGNCLFRAISLQVYGSEDMHSTVRSQCLDFMEVESQHFKDFVAEPYQDYITRKRCDGVHGNHAEIQAASELYNRRIEVYVPPKLEPMNIFQQEEEKDKSEGSGTNAISGNHPIRLLYMDGNHYDALIDPLVPTAGLGLGLPGLQPDKLQLDQANIQRNMEQKMQLAMEESKRVQDEKEGEEIQRVLRESCMDIVGGSGGRLEREEVEDAFEKKAMYLSELDAADFDLEQAVSSCKVHCTIARDGAWVIALKPSC